MEKSILFLILISFISSCNEINIEQEPIAIQKSKNQDDLCIATTRENQNSRGQIYNEFDSYNANYNVSGQFLKDMVIPFKSIQINGRNILLMPSIVDRINISKRGSYYAILEILRHGQDDTTSLRGQRRIIQPQSGRIKNIIPNFPSDKLHDSIILVSLHDEDYYRYQQSVRDAINVYLKTELDICHTCPINEDGLNILLDSVSRIDKMKPATLGGGVIPPE